MSKPITKQELLAALLAYPDKDKVPFNELAKRFKVHRTKLMGLTSALVRGSSKTLLELKELGYTMEEVPPWVGSKLGELPEKECQPGQEQSQPKPELVKATTKEQGKQLQRELEQKQQQENTKILFLGKESPGGAARVPVGSSSSSSNGSSPTGSPPSLEQSSPPAMSAALKLMNQQEDGSSIEFEGHRYKVSRANGEIKLTPVEQNIVGADPILAAAMSKAIIENIEVNMLAVAKKVALSPVVVIGHGIVTATVDEEGKPLFVGDIGDFINWCCDFALRTAFGIRIGVITGAPSLMSAMKARREQMAPKLEMRDIV